MSLARGVCAALVLASAAMGSWAQQPPVRPMARLGVFSLLGDGVEVTVAPPISDTRVDAGRRETFEYRDIGFDIIAGREVREAAGRLRPGITVVPFGTNTTLPAAEQRHIAAGARDGALPAWILQAVRDRRLSHVLLLTRQRGEVRLLTADNSTIARQRGRVDGLGFYLDPEYKVRDTNTGAVSNGALGPHVLVELTLMETDSAKVVRSHTIDEQFLLGAIASQGTVDPWSYLSAEQKVTLLREALARALRRVLPEFLKDL